MNNKHKSLRENLQKRGFISRIELNAASRRTFLNYERREMTLNGPRFSFALSRTLAYFVVKNWLRPKAAPNKTSWFHQIIHQGKFLYNQVRSIQQRPNQLGCSWPLPERQWTEPASSGCGCDPDCDYRGESCNRCHRPSGQRESESSVRR